METQIYIRGFPKATTKEELREYFNQYSSIEGVRIIKDYAFIVNLFIFRILKRLTMLIGLSATNKALSFKEENSKSKLQANLKSREGLNLTINVAIVVNWGIGNLLIIQEERVF